MESQALLRQQIIKNFIAQHTENAADAAITHWEQLAAQIISIVGNDGFNSLYARSLFITQSIFAWLAAGSLSPQTDHRFAELKISFKGRPAEQVSEANTLLLLNFTDILASLIGEEFTTTILCLAWNIDESGKIGKEFK
ncbi:MAG: hypothetical protein V4443_00620 [Pseudomonadota bacterium]